MSNPVTVSCPAPVSCPVPECTAADLKECNTQLREYLNFYTNKTKAEKNEHILLLLTTIILIVASLAIPAYIISSNGIDCSKAIDKQNAKSGYIMGILFVILFSIVTIIYLVLYNKSVSISLGLEEKPKFKIFLIFLIVMYVISLVILGILCVVGSGNCGTNTTCPCAKFPLIVKEL